MSDFLTSWALFGETYVVGLAAAVTLALVGVWVVARDQIFLGAAVSQASTLGIALALWLGARVHGLGGWLESEAAATALAVTASVATAWLAGRPREAGRESAESVTGWIFLLASSLPVLLLAHSPHGLEEVHRLVFSTLLSVTRFDLALFVTMAGVSAVGVALLRDRLLLLAMDPVMAGAVGLHRSAWTGGMALWLGFAVGLSIHVAGMLYTFGCLVLPALLAKNLCREVRTMLWTAPVLAVAFAFTGFALAHVADLPPAHTSVGLMGAALPGAWLWRQRRGSLLEEPSAP